MEGGVRTVGPSGGGQRATDTGPQPPAPPPQQTAYPQRILSSSTSSTGSGASPVHRPVDTPQSYSKGLLSSVQSPTPSARSAASPLSPPRPGPGAPPTTYPPFPGREAPPARYLQQQTTHYGTSAQVPYRENPYARMPQQQNEYRGSAAGSGLVNSNGGGHNPLLDTASNKSAGKYSSSSSISNNVNLQPLGSTMGGSVGQQPQAVVIEAGCPPSGQIRNRISLLPLQSTQQQQPMDFEYSRHSGMQQPSLQLHQTMPQHQPLLTIHATDLGGPPMTKKIRLTSMETHHHHHQQQQPPQHIVSSGIMSKTPPLLKVDTREPTLIMSSGAYHPQVEAISPTLPPDPQDEWRAMKDELLQKIAKVDIDIQKVEKQIMNLKNEEASLQVTSTKPAAAEEATEIPPKHRSLAQIIYAENRRKANLAHGVLLAMGPPVELPLYNQPSDTEMCRGVIEKHESFKLRLLRHFHQTKTTRFQRNMGFSDCYAEKSQDWQRRVEKSESTAKRKAKEAKNREFFEKVFPELRKQREDKERFNRVGSRVKSEADLEEIMDGLQEQALEDKKMRSYAVIPPLMLDNEQKRYPFMNENGLLLDIVSEAKDREHLNVWTAGEKEVFKEKYLQHPKNFCAIAVNLDRKSVSDCVKFYYLSKKTENYKQLLRKARQRTRSSRNPQKSVPAQVPCIVDAMTTGVTTRLQREQQQKTGGRDRAANSASNNNNNGCSSAATGTTATTSATTCNSNNNSTTQSTSTISSTSASSSNRSNSINNPVSTNNINLSTSVGNSASGAGGTLLNNGSGTPGMRCTTTPPATVNTTNSFNAPQSTAVDPLPMDYVSSIAATTAADSHATSPIMPSNHKYGDSPTLLTYSTNSNVEHKPSLNHCDIGNVDRDTNNVPADVGIKGFSTDSVNEKPHCGDALSADWPRSATDPPNTGPNSSTSGVAAVKKDDPFAAERVCAVCKTKSGPMIYLEKGRGHLYGILEEAFLEGRYACHDCELDMRSWRPTQDLSRRNYPMCPLVTCVNMSRRKRFRSIPSRLFDLSPDIRDPVLREFRVPEGVKECCEMCVIKIRKRIKKHFKSTTLTEAELSSMKTVLSKFGPDWERMEKLIGKPAKALRIYFIDNKKTKNLGSLVQNYFSSNPQIMPGSITDGENTDWSSSDEEREGASDTASAESPNNPVVGPVSTPVKSEVIGLNSSGPPNVHKAVEDERLMPPHGFLSKKHKISEECDSSATETADEENESSPANRHSPKGHLQFGNQTTITMVPSNVGGGLSQLNGPIRDSPRNVQDVISDVIERGLKGPSLVPPMMKTSSNSLSMGIKSMVMGGDRSNDRVDLSRVNESLKSRVLNHENSLATLSVVNSQVQHGLTHGHNLVQDRSGMVVPREVLSAHAIHNQIAATITPVPLSTPSGIGQLPHSSSLQIIPSDSSTGTVRMPPVPLTSGAPTGTDTEPQTLDLSIKKRDANVFPPPKSIHNSTTIYRNENIMQPMYAPPESYPNYRMTKSPINIPMQSRRAPPPPGMSPQNMQHHQQMVIHPQQQQPQQQQLPQPSTQPSKPPQKSNSKMSPKHQGGGGNNALMGGTGAKSVGSITHGTPLNSLGATQSGMLIQAGTTLSPRVDGMMRQTPPDTGAGAMNKAGSITQGTPLHMVPMHMQLQGENSGPKQSQQPPPVRSPYDGQPMGNNSRQSPAYQQGPAGQPPPGSVYARPSGMQYAGHEAQQWSSRQILTNDYLTSQQMHRGGNAPPIAARSEKDSASPRSLMLSSSGSSQAGGYYEKDQRSASRESMMSRSSPVAERMLHGSPSPMRTPPPQRQGVIQRHNTVGPGGTPNCSQGGNMSKPPSPASNRIHIMPHYPPPGHEALSSLVDVAVQQPLLPVPHKDDKGRIPMSADQKLAMRQQMEVQRRPGAIPPSQQMYLRDQQMQMDHLREMEHKQREQREREHLAERDREHRERERERSIMAERDRNMYMERDRERLAASGRPSVYDEQEERRKYGNPNQTSFGRERPMVGPMRNDGESLTAANLIDAIITHQITQSNVDTSLPGRELHRPNYYSVRDHAHSLPPLPGTVGGGEPNNGKSQSPHVIKIDLDSDGSSGAANRATATPPTNRLSGAVKNITIGQITDSVISKDFASNSMLSLRPSYGSAYHPDQQTPDWMRRLPAAVPVSQPGGSGEPTKDSKDMARVPTPDDRQIIHLAQTPSPRSKATNVPIHEPVSPPDDSSRPQQLGPLPSHYYNSMQTAISLQPLQGGGFPDRRPNSGPPMPTSSGPPTTSHQASCVLDYYIKNRIVEEMRIQEKGGGDRQGGEKAVASAHDRSSTPAMMDDDSLARPNSRPSGTAGVSGASYGPATNAPHVSTTVAYPFSAWNVTGAPASNNVPVPPPSLSHPSEMGGGNGSGSIGVNIGGGGGQPAAEPKPLLSSQYEALSDEEENPESRN